MITPQGLGNSTASSEFAIANRLGKLSSQVELTGKRILDIGCNDAAYTLRLAEAAQLTAGIDVETERLSGAIRRIRSKGNNIPVAVFQMDASRQAFRDSSFDIVFINEALEHIPDQEGALGEIYRVLCKGGHFILFAPNRLYPFETHGARIGRRKFGRFIPLVHWLPRTIGKHFMNARSYTAGELRQLLRAHDLIPVHLSYLFPPLDGLKNRLERYRLAGLVYGYRRIIQLISRCPIVGAMGLSLFVIAVKIDPLATEHG